MFSSHQYCRLSGIFICQVANSEELGIAEQMGSTDKTVKFLHALANESRLQILDCVRNGIKNPGQMSKKLKRHRSTIEKHLRILLKANLIEKIPSLTSGGQLSVRYEIRETVNKPLTIILDQCENL